MEKAYKTEHNFTDYREMLDKMGDKIDAVTVSVPDHNHAVMAAKAMRMGKHVLLPEAAHAFDLGSPPPRRDRPRDGRRHANGQSVDCVHSDCARRPTRFAKARWAP